MIATLLGVVGGPRVGAADGAPAEAEAVHAAQERYAGTWRVVAIEGDGQRTADDGRRIVVTNQADGSWTLMVDGRLAARGTNRFDPLATPAEIDIEITEGDGKGRKLLGIYEVTETTRRLCFRGDDGWRPREFVTTPGCGAVLVMFERE